MEITLIVKAPGLEAAMNNLAAAIGGAKSVPDLAQNVPVEAPATIPTAPVQAPAPTAAAPSVPAMQAAPNTPAPAQAATPSATATPHSEAVVTAPAPAPIAHPAPAPVTMQAIATAGAALIDAGPENMAKLIGLLQSKYGVQTITQLKPEQFEAFAADLRAMGAKL